MAMAPTPQTREAAVTIRQRGWPEQWDLLRTGAIHIVLRDDDTVCFTFPCGGVVYHTARRATVVVPDGMFDHGNGD